MKEKKYYVVWKGHKPGVYAQWDEAKKQIDGYKGPAFKSYPSKMEAEKAFTQGAESYDNSGGINYNSISVDAACAGNPGVMEYQGVVTQSKKQLFHQGPFPLGTNNIGEFLGIVHALALLDKNQKYDVTIYTDSMTAITWVRNKKIKTTLERNAKTAALFDLIDRAYTWLDTHEVKNPIVKWDTDKWGEIPADFGRK